MSEKSVSMNVHVTVENSRLNNSLETQSCWHAFKNKNQGEKKAADGESKQAQLDKNWIKT